MVVDINITGARSNRLRLAFGLQHSIGRLMRLLLGQSLRLGRFILGQLLDVLLLALEQAGGLVAEILQRCYLFLNKSSRSDTVRILNQHHHIINHLHFSGTSFLLINIQLQYTNITIHFSFMVIIKSDMIYKYVKMMDQIW